MLKLVRYSLVALLVTTAAACSHGSRSSRRENPEFLTLSKEQLFQKGEDQFNRKRYQKARSYFTHVYENYPNDPLGRRSLLRMADTYFMQGDPVNLVEAQYKYRDFINRYPSSESADYAMLQIANVAFKQMERPDRDQQKTIEAVEKYNDMLRAYPKSPLREEAEKNLQLALDRLAKHEHLVAKYYMRRNSFLAAVQRLNYLIDQYPNYGDRAGAFYDLGNSLANLGRLGEARLYFERVITEFPKSDYADKARRRLDQLKT